MDIKTSSQTSSLDRISISFSFIVDKERVFMPVELSWRGKPQSTALSSLMTFLFENEKQLHSDDSTFCYLLAKLIKKIQIGNQFFLGIPDDTDMALFFKKAIEHKLDLFWQNGDEIKLLEYDYPLPLTFAVSSGFNGVLTCKMVGRDTWLKEPLGWLTFVLNHTTMCFCNGILIERMPRDLEDFISLFLDDEAVQYPEQEAIKFIHQVYGPHKKRVLWQIQADFSAILPQETTPTPVLTLTENNETLTPILNYQYGPTMIDPNFKGSFVKDKETGKYYKRMAELEHIYQQDLIDIFTEYDLALMLQTPGDIAVFLDDVVPILVDRGWVVHNFATEIQIHQEPLTLNFSIESSNMDWFSFEAGTSIGGQRMAFPEIARLMIENKGYFKTKTGYVRLSSESQKQLTTLTKMGAFKSGSRFSKAEIVPLIASANLSGKDKNSQAWIDRLENLHKSGHCVPSKQFSGTLRDYQQFGLNWLHFLEQGGFGGILADDMGLGKTIQAIAFSSQLPGKGPILVVGPTNVLYNWQAEIGKFLPGSDVVIYAGGSRSALTKKLPIADFIITTFGLIKNDSELLSKIPFRAIFVDEAQYIKNPQAQVSQAIKLLQSPYKLAMTGTPIENHLQDLWNLFDFVMPGYLGTKREFDILVKDGHLDMVKTKIKPFVLRREKREVLQSLPEKTEILLKCAMSKPQKQLYETVLAAVKQGIRNSSGKTEKLNILTSLLKLRQVCTHPGLLKEFQGQEMESAKYELAQEKISELIDEGHKIVLFSQFTQMLDILQTWGKKEKIYMERIDGSVTGKSRSEAVNRYQSHIGAGLFLVSLKAGGVGINLTAADYVIHMDPWWNPAIESQATDRVHRMGQENKVIVYKLITEGTIEEKIQELQESKRALLTQIIDIDNINEKAIDFKDLEALLS